MVFTDEIRLVYCMTEHAYQTYLKHHIDICLLFVEKVEH